MDFSSATIPFQAVVAAVFVLVYSAICLSCGLLLVWVLVSTRDISSYVFLLAVSTSLSTSFNMIQHIYYLANWHDQRQGQYEASLAAYDKPSLALGPLAKGPNEALFWTVLYFYNVDSMLMMFWAISLVFSVWGWKSRKVQHNQYWIGITSKVVAWVLPVLVISLRKAYQLRINFSSAVVLLNILLLCSFSIGTICIILILTKYLQARLTVDSYSTGNAPSAEGPGTLVHRSMWSGLKFRVDPWLVLRFTIAFLFLCLLEVFLITFEVRRYRKIQKSARQKQPDFGVAATITDTLNYIPGATASLLVFLLFGTTGHLRSMYRSLLKRTNPFRRRKSPALSEDTEDWTHITRDVEMMGTRSAITKNTSVEVSVSGKDDVGCNDFERYALRTQNAWFPGQDLGVLHDP